MIQILKGLADITPEEVLLEKLKTSIDSYLANKNKADKTALIFDLQICGIKLMDIKNSDIQKADEARKALEFFKEVENLKKE